MTECSTCSCEFSLEDEGGIAEELNEIRTEAQQFIKDHFVFVTVGGK